MSEEVMGAQDDGDIEAPRKRSSRMLVVVLAVLAVSVVAGWFGYSYLETRKEERAQAEARKAAQAKAAAAQASATQPTPLDDDMKLAAELQRQKAEAEEAVRRATEDRDRVAKELDELKAQVAKGTKPVK